MLALRPQVCHRKGGRAFWADFTGHYFARLCQDLITIGLAHGWIGC